MERVPLNKIFNNGCDLFFSHEGDIYRRFAANFTFPAINTKNIK